MSSRGPLVAARLLDGTVTKGVASVFDPRKGIRLLEAGAEDEIALPARSLKAVFFIKDAQGDPLHAKTNRFEDSQLIGKRVWVEFADGEEMAGLSQSFQPGKDGFYVFPTDPGSNVEMAFVFRHALRKVLEQDAAEAAAAAHAELHRRDPDIRKRAEQWENFIESVS